MTKRNLKVGDTLLFTESYSQWNKGEKYRVLAVHDDGTLRTIENRQPIAWRVTQERLSGEMKSWMEGMGGWHIDSIPTDAYIVVHDDACGDCSSSCRSEKGKCVFYSE